MTFTSSTSSQIGSFHCRLRRAPTDRLERSFRLLRDPASRKALLASDELRLFGPWNPFVQAHE